VLVTAELLKSGFSSFISPGMMILVHSSLSSLGRVEGGAFAVISSLKKVITSDGIIMMPTFTYGRDIFDPFKSQSHTGMISEEFRKSAGVKRSLHPTHSVCAWGNDADYFLAGHEVEAPFSVGTPLHKLCLNDGYVMLIGVGHEANSMIHVAQELANVPYLDRSKLVKVLKDGNIIEVRARRTGCSLGFNKAEPFLASNNLVAHYKIGNAQISFMKANPVVEKLTEILKKDSFMFICDNKNCFACNEARIAAKRNL